MRTALIVSALLMLAPAGLRAEPAPARIGAISGTLSPEPRGFGRPITDRAAWNDLARRKEWSGVVSRAERHLTEPMPEMTEDLYLDFSRTGRRDPGQRVIRARRRRLGDLALAECLEDKGRFLPAFERAVRELCAEPTWVLPAHDGDLRNYRGERTDIDLASSALAWQMATAEYLLRDRLSSETRRLIRENVRRRVLEPFRRMVRGERRENWWLSTTNNWNAVCLAGVTGAALAIAESPEERAFYVAAAEELSRNFLRGFTPDGYCSEGLGYWNYGFGHYVLLSEAIYQATGGGVDLLSHPEAAAPARFGARLEILNGVYPAFADCPVDARPSSRLMYFVGRRFRLGLEEWEERDVSGPGGSLPEALMYSFPNSASEREPAPAGEGGPGPRSWFPDAGVLIGRPRAGGRLGVALKGGHNGEHHNHNDVGSYVAAVGGQAVLVDPGSEVYTARTFGPRRYESNVLNSWGHPVPVVNGRLQRTGREARAAVLEAEFTEATDRLVLDLTSAYEAPELEGLRRTFVYDRRGGGGLMVTDEARFSEPRRFGTALVTLGRWERTGPRTLRVYDTMSGVDVTVSASAEFAVSSETINEDVRARGKPTRVGIDLREPVLEATIAVTIRPSDFRVAGLPNGGFERGTWGWELPAGGMAEVSEERAAGGRRALHIRDTEDERGSNISSARFPGGPGPHAVRGKVCPISGDGLGIYVRCLDAEGRLLNETDGRGWISPVTSLGGSSGEWRPFESEFDCPDGTAYLQLWIHSYNAARVEACLDDLAVGPVGEGTTAAGENVP
ncbi:MAG: heparinase II/III family protein [Candidatus Brocadiia bacterium]